MLFSTIFLRRLNKIQEVKNEIPSISNLVKKQQKLCQQRARIRKKTKRKQQKKTTKNKKQKKRILETSVLVE